MKANIFLCNEFGMSKSKGVLIYAFYVLQLQSHQYFSCITFVPNCNLQKVRRTSKCHDGFYVFVLKKILIIAIASYIKWFQLYDIRFSINDIYYMYF